MPNFTIERFFGDPSLGNVCNTKMFVRAKDLPCVIFGCSSAVCMVIRDVWVIRQSLDNLRS